MRTEEEGEGGDVKGKGKMKIFRVRKVPSELITLTDYSWPVHSVCVQKSTDPINDIRRWNSKKNVELVENVKLPLVFKGGRRMT